jgi:hypothetical protein
LAQAGTLEKLASYLGQTLQTLAPDLAPDQIEGFLAELGIGVPAGFGAEAQFAGAVATIVTDIGALASIVANLIEAIEAENVEQIVSSATQVINQASTIFTAFQRASTALNNAAAGAAGLTAAQIQNLQNLAQQLVKRLLDYAIIEALRTYSCTVVAALNLLGLIDDGIVAGTPGDLTSPPYHARTLHLDRAFDLFTSPQKYLQETFGWGTAAFDGSALFSKLSTVFGAAGLPAITILAPGQSPAFDAFLVRLSTDTNVNPPGISATLRIPAIQNFQQTYTLSPLWSLNLSAAAEFDAGLTAAIVPPLSATLSNSSTVSLQLTGGFTAQNGDGTPIVIFGETGGSGLFAQSFAFSAGVQATWNAATSTASAEPVISFAVSGGKLYIDTSQSDGFISTITSGVDINASFDLSATWDPSAGLHIQGGAQLEIDLPLHLSLGPITIPTVYVIGGLTSSGLTIELSAALGVELGPIQGSVDRLGLQGVLSFPGTGGNLGPADLTLSPKPPNGIGLSIDAGVVTGGGYISFDPAKGQYAGVLQVSLADTIGVTVIGVIDTIMPDGSSGFSFILIITFTLPPIQLGFGFTLNGVGGLGGVNRTMDTNALQAGFRAHTLDSIMFPPDPIDNAPQIISDIESFFPVAQGNYVFGPLLEFGWGEPPLISFTLGVILSLPNPIVIAILGLIDAGLPTQDEALIEIHVEVLGIIDFGTKTLSIDGSMYDSNVLIYALAGDLAMRLSWGSNSNFLYSLGGFNPNFNTDGLDVPQLARLSVSLGYGDNPRISSNSYFAVTSNTVQFGANVQAYAAAGGFSIQGYLGFDVLIVISPFSFEFDFTCSFDVAYDGATLLGLNVNGVFQGPTPWHFHGEVSISFLFFSVSASVDLTWGSSTQATIPSKPVLPDLFAAFQNPQDWSAALPAATPVGVSFATQNPNAQTLCVHPMGTLQVKERVVPLDQPITMYGNAAPSDGTEFSIQSVQIDSQTETIASITDLFAPGQFLTLSDADKLSTPSFEPFDAGVTIGSSAVLNGQDSPRTVTYNEFYIYDLSSFSQFSRVYQMPANVHLALSAQGAGFTSPAKNTGLAKYSIGQAPSPITVSEPQYVVASVTDLGVRADISPGSGTNYFGAKAALSAYLAANPADSQNLQIIPLHEVPA